MWRKELGGESSPPCFHLGEGLFVFFDVSNPSGKGEESAICGRGVLECHRRRGKAS